MYLDEKLIAQFKALQFLEIVAILLVIGISSYIIIRILKIPVIRGKGIKSELDNLNKIRSRDAYILKVEEITRKLVGLVEKSVFRIEPNSKEYIQYNLNRANVKVIGGHRNMLAEEYNALLKISTLGIIILGLLVSIIKSASIGFIIIIAGVVIINSLPMMLLRGAVAAKDKEIRDNFLDYYLMLHYVIYNRTNVPLNKIMKSYRRRASSEEMKRYVDNCINYIETYGEYNATNYIAKDYREIPEVGKLMRLIRQSYDGGAVEQDLIGFRSELIKKERYAVEDRKEKNVKKAQMSFNVLMILLIQAILSAMSIYLPDIGIAKSLFGM